MLTLLLIGSALAEEPVWPVRPPRPPPPKTLQDYVDQSQLVLHVRVDHLEPFDVGELLEGTTGTEVHMVVLEELKGSTPDHEVWFPFGDHYRKNFLLSSAVGTEMLLFAVSIADARPASAQGIHMPYAGTLIRSGVDGVIVGDGSVARLLAPDQTLAWDVLAQAAPALSWNELILETKAAIARSSSTNAVVVGGPK